jgi:hypothetical protein
MSRKLFLAALAIALPVALLATIGSGAASGQSVRPATPVTFVGNISCNLQGTITITPAATNTNPGPWVVKFTGKNNKCVGLPYTNTAGTTVTTPLTQSGEKLKSSTETFTFTVTGTGALGTLCHDLELGGPIATPITVAINWLGTSPITGTQVSYPNGGTIYPGLIALLNGTTGGSFAGTADILLGYNLANVFTACASTAGLSTLPVNHLGGDNLMVGPAF